MRLSDRSNPVIRQDAFFPLLLQHKSVALTVTINKRDRSSMGARLVTSFLLCNKRVWKQHASYPGKNSKKELNRGRLLQGPLWPAIKIFSRDETGVTDSSQEWSHKVWVRCNAAVISLKFKVKLAEHSIEDYTTCHWICTKLSWKFWNTNWISIPNSMTFGWYLCEWMANVIQVAPPVQFALDLVW